MATIPGIPGDERQVDPAVQAQRDQERLTILRAESSDQRLPADARAAVGREISRMGAAPAPAQAPAIPAAQEEDLRNRSVAAAAATPRDGMLSLYGESLDAAVQRRLANPEPAEDPSWDTWSGVKALIASGPLAGGLEMAGTATDLASGAAAPLASTGGSAGGMFSLPSDEERKQQEEARQRMLSGPAFDPAMGNVLRAKAREFAPDPLTSHRSTQLLHGLSAGLTKAVGATLLFGAVPGAAVFGAEEANTTAQNLITDGVDPETAAKVGAVTGIASAVGAGLPVVGGTLAKTAALAVVGGPGTFVAQEALSRKILQEAGYAAQAEMHDPTDPWMLALSTAVPFAVGGIAMRQAARAKAAGAPRPQGADAAADPKPAAEAAAKPAEATPAVDDMTIATAARDPATVDAARVHVLEQAEAKHIPPDVPPQDAARGIDAVREAVEAGEMEPMLRMASQQEGARPSGDATWFSGAPAGLDELRPDLARDGNLYGPGVYVARKSEFADTYDRGEGRTVYRVDFAPQRPFQAADIMPAASAAKMLLDLGVPKAKVTASFGGKPRVAGSTVYKALSDGLGGKAQANSALAAAGYDAILFKSNRGDELAVSLKPVKTAAMPAKADAEPGQPRAPEAQERVPSRREVGQRKQVAVLRSLLECLA
jgi:hypothetical protein